MLAFLKNAAFWASLAGLFDSLAITLPHGTTETMLALVSAVCGVIGIIEALWASGHRVQYVPPAKE